MALEWLYRIMDVSFYSEAQICIYVHMHTMYICMYMESILVYTYIDLCIVFRYFMKQKKKKSMGN